MVKENPKYKYEGIIKKRWMEQMSKKSLKINRQPPTT